MRSSIPRRRATSGLLVCGLLLSVCACSTFDPSSMIRLQPPDNWTELLRVAREAKDVEFRTDPETPLVEEHRAGFEGLDYWPPDGSYYFVGPINFYAEPQQFTIVSTTGKPRPCERVGYVQFDVAGQRQSLQVYRLLDSERQQGVADLFLPFMDATTGEETYSAGRYVDLRGPQGGPYVLDFNDAYNPLCAYGSPERYSCPRTPTENRLDVRIEAGERGLWHEPPG